jgi:hypothetical protein
MGQPHAQKSHSILEDVNTTAMSHPMNGEFQGLEELLAEYKDNFSGDNEDYGRTNKVYHRIYVSRTESHEQIFSACNLGTADEREYGGRWNQLLC